MSTTSSEACLWPEGLLTSFASLNVISNRPTRSTSAPPCPGSILSSSIPLNPRGPFLEKSLSEKSLLSCMERIQEDFPRTPSPIYGNEKAYPKENDEEVVSAGSTVVYAPAETSSYSSKETLSSSQFNLPYHDDYMISTTDDQYAVEEEQDGMYLPPWNQLIDCASDQHGSRFLQEMLSSGNVSQIEGIQKVLLPHTRMLMRDVFGNYVIQRIWEMNLRNVEKQNELMSYITHDVISLSLHMYGCRVIQKALECGTVDIQWRIMSEIQGYVLHLIQDQNGNHVIQKILQIVPWTNRHEYVQNISSSRGLFVLEAMVHSVVLLSSHPYGCRVVQRAWEQVNVEWKELLWTEIFNGWFSLVHDQYGNYVIQYVLENGSYEHRCHLIDVIIPHTGVLSQHKFASNVVEKALLFGNKKQRSAMIHVVISNETTLQRMMKDQFGNYVVQKLIDVANLEERNMILQSIQSQVNLLKKYTYGKHIVARLEKLTLGHCK